MLILFFFSIHPIKSSSIEVGNSTSHNNQSVSPADNSDFHLSCIELEISLLSDEIQAICNDKKTIMLNYTDLFNFRANIYSELIIRNYSRQNIDDYFLQIGRLIYFSSKSKVKFEYIWNFSLIETFVNMHQSSQITPWVSVEWKSFYQHSQSYCAWDKDTYYNNFKQDKLFIRDMLIETMKDSNWKKVCLDHTGWLFYQEGQDEKIEDDVTVHEIALLYALITVLLIIIVIVISLYLIAFCRYKKKDPVQNDYSLSSSSYPKID